MITFIRIDGCADQIKKKPDIIFWKHKIIASENAIPQI